MAVKKRMCYKDRLKTHDPATIKSIIEGTMNAERYLERKAGKRGNTLLLVTVVLLRALRFLTNSCGNR